MVWSGLRYGPGLNTCFFTVAKAVNLTIVRNALIFYINFNKFHKNIKNNWEI